MDQSNKLEELIKTSKNKEELRDSIKEAGLVLTDTELDQVTGGAFFADIDKVTKA